MSPRRTRAATAGQSVSTRSKTPKIYDVNEDVAKQTRQSQRKDKSSNVKNKLEASTKQNAIKEPPDAKIVSKKPVKKKVSRRKLNLSGGIESEDKAMVQKNLSMDSNESIRTLRDKRNSSISMTELTKNNLPQSNALQSSDSDEMFSKKLQCGNSVINIPVIVTPKSTPPKLNLTPHRSKKTPKKSPISLDSPKTHSLTIPKLFKSPRKLSLATTSEEDLDKFDSSSRKKSRKIKKDNLSNISIPDNGLLTSPVVKDKHKKSDTHLKNIVRKFSKSPKIVLRSPRSKKSKSRKLKLLSPSRIKRSLLKVSSPDTTPDLGSAKSTRISTKESPVYKKRNLSAIKRRLLDPRLTKAMTPSQIKDVLQEPIVLVEKLSLENVKKAGSKSQSNTLIKVGSPLNLRNNKVLTPVTPRISAELIMSANKNFNAKLRNSSVERSSNRVSPRLKQNISIQSKDRSSIPLMSSTPREEETPLTVINLTSNTSIVDNTLFSPRLRHRNQSNTQLSNINSIVIENIFKPSPFNKDISNTSQSHLSSISKQDTNNKDSTTMQAKEENRKDNTYELEQPQTLSLKQMIKKRTSTDANLSPKKNVKKAKVHFADVTLGRSSARKSINKSIRLRSNAARNITTQKGSTINLAPKSKKIETPKLSRNSLRPSFKARSSSQTNGVTPRTQLSGMQVTPKTFTSIEKKSEKKSSVKRKPNFEKIHEQMFARSESLVDAKKRLAARHLAFTASKDPKVDVKKEEKKPLPTDTKDGTHNRFGFKLRKAEATRAILKKQTVFSRQKKQHETRMMLQGVRTNRRFELQMKARNINE